MRYWLCAAVLTTGPAWLAGCDKQADQPSIELVDRSPILGVWHLQADGDRPVAIDTTIRFDFRPGGEALYRRTAGGPEEPDVFTLGYNLTGDIISIDGPADTPGAPHITGKVVFAEDGQSLRITTHEGEDWLLTRGERPGGEVEASRRVKQIGSTTDARLPRVQQLAYACIAFANQTGEPPTSVSDLIDAELIRPEQLLASGRASDLPAGYIRMDADERGKWIESNCHYAFFFQYAGTGQASSVLVCTLPSRAGADVVIGMANGAVFKKPASEVALLLELQIGSLPEGWPGSDRASRATAGVELLSD